MKKSLFFIIFYSFSLSTFCQEYQNIPVKRLPVADTFYTDYIIKDHFRWMETTDENATKDWLKAQNKMSRKYLRKVVRETGSNKKVDFYSSYYSNSETRLGDYLFKYIYYHEYGLPALLYKYKTHKNYKVLFNPNSLLNGKPIILNDYSVSYDSKYLAYQFSVDGTDWAQVKIFDLKEKVTLQDHLKGLKFSPIVWVGHGFLYSVYYQLDKYSQTFGQRVVYHKVGTPQEEDRVLFARLNPYVNFGYNALSDQRYLVLEEINEYRGVANYFYIDFHAEEPNFKPLFTNLQTSLSIIGAHDGKFLAISYYNNNNGSLVMIDPENPFTWKPIFPEYPDAVLLRAKNFKDRIAAIYQVKEHPVLMIADHEGNILYKLDLPISTSVTKFNGNYDDKKVFLSFESYTIPRVNYELDLYTFERTLKNKTKITFDYKDIKYKEIECLTRDSVKIPVTIVYKDTLKLNGENPLLLKSYGGFGMVSQPSFDGGLVHFIKSGGVFAFAKIRGGGDKGKKWFFQGAGMNKKKSFEDFIDVADFLVEKQYTNPDKLAATGASNGGLVCATAAIKRPDLFKAVVPIAAPLDMLRFEKYTIGAMHTDEYGSVYDSTSFVLLKDYSPYQNIEKGVNYPAMLLITGENDDRVPPFHSYKFVAKLQNRTAQQNPVLLSVTKKAGHQGAARYNDWMDNKEDAYGFIMYQLGME